MPEMKIEIPDDAIMEKSFEKQEMVWSQGDLYIISIILLISGNQN